MKILYISYDGMTDNLGASQVIPYLRSLTEAGHEFHLLSCEKPEKGAGFLRMQQYLSDTGIRWHPITYHKRPPVLSSLYDLWCLRKLARRICLENEISVVHCRSYLPALIGLGLKKKFGIKFIFDMRGFWADERVDGGLWKIQNPIFAAIFRYFKRKESQFLYHANAVVSLTQSGKEEMLTWPVLKKNSGIASRISVIPCCVDLNHFDPARVDSDQKKMWREKLKLTEGELIFAYLGSLGTWYLLEEMLTFFKEILGSRPNAKFLWITPDLHSRVYLLASRMGIPPESLRVVSAERKDVPALLSIAHVGVFFIKPSYSKISSSATKMAELLAMGLPVIANAGIGDHRRLFAKGRIGYLLEDFSSRSFENASSALPKILSLDSDSIRNFARENFSLADGAKHYLQIYSKLEGPESIRYI